MTSEKSNISALNIENCEKNLINCLFGTSHLEGLAPKHKSIFIQLLNISKKLRTYSIQLLSKRVKTINLINLGKSGLMQDAKLFWHDESL